MVETHRPARCACPRSEARQQISLLGVELLVGQDARVAELAELLELIHDNLVVDPLLAEPLRNVEDRHRATLHLRCSSQPGDQATAAFAILDHVGDDQRGADADRSAADFRSARLNAWPKVGSRRPFVLPCRAPRFLWSVVRRRGSCPSGGPDPRGSGPPLIRRVAALSDQLDHVPRQRAIRVEVVDRDLALGASAGPCHR
jgi:hypothetical protein